MKLFLDRNKTLLPRLDTIYLISRAGVLVGLAWYLLSSHHQISDSLFTYGLIGTFVAHIILFWLAVQGTFDIKLGYLTSIIYDLLVMPALIVYTGGINSSFFLLFLLTISVAAYVLTFWFATGVALIASLVYLISVYTQLTMETSFDIGIRVGFFLIFYLAISYASGHMRKSEKRLLKLFDTLNMRTSELERSQAHLEMIYENSRILTTILKPESVVKEIMRILGVVMGYTNYGILFKDKHQNLVYRARSVNNDENYHMKAVDTSKMELLQRIFDADEPVCVKDIQNRDDYEPLNDESRSVMVVPMNAHGQVNGILIVESDDTDQFTERNIQMLSVVARSAAMALENAELHHRTEELTIIDELTDTYNYRYFISKLDEEKRRASRYDLPLSLIMVDIDWFKKFNDSFGHEVGNIVLKELSAIIKTCIRDVDIFARYGGEEFVVILPQTPLHEARTIGERIREQVERHVIETSSAGQLRITVSVGVSSFPENGKPQEELVTVADQALYRAKDEGRNHVCVM